MVGPIIVPASKAWVETSVRVSRGQVLNFVAEGIWWDAVIPCTAEGYPASFLYAIGRPPRIPDHGRYFRLMGRIVPGDAAPIQDDTAATFRIGSNRTYRVTESGRLLVFVNDRVGYYWNNWGMVRLIIE